MAQIHGVAEDLVSLESRLVGDRRRGHQDAFEVGELAPPDAGHAMMACSMVGTGNMQACVPAA
jgi:hypothetical protein